MLQQVIFLNETINIKEYIDIEDYDICCQIASSTHSKVYKATHKLTKKTYALKTFPYCSTDIEYFLDLLNTYSNIDGILKIKAYKFAFGKF